MVPRSASQIEVVDVEAEPDTASPSNIPPVTEPTGVEPSSPPRATAKSKSGGRGKVPLSLGGPPLVIYPEIPEGERDEEHRELVRHYEARVLEGEEARRIIDDYFADDAPSEEKDTTSRKDLEPFFRGRVGEKVVPLLAELAQGVISGMCDIPLRNLARNGTDNEVSLASAGRLAALRVSPFTLFLTVFFLCLG